MTVPMNPFVSSEYEYITVTRGKKHIFTMVKADGKTFSFDWGEGGHMIISDSLEVLKSRVTSFIEHENLIPLEWTGEKFTAAKLYFNNYFYKWQFMFSGVTEKEKNLYDGYYFMEKDVTFDQVLEIAKKIIKVETWNLVETTELGIPFVP